MPSAESLRIGYVVKRYPCYSETFIVREILAHERAGLGIDFVSVLPTLTPATGLGAKAVAAYAERQGVDVDTFIESLRPELTAEQVGKSVSEIATGTRRDHKTPVDTANNTARPTWLARPRNTVSPRWPDVCPRPNNNPTVRTARTSPHDASSISVTRTASLAFTC